eukprot:scaffold663_cov341-Pavlova_lutheri.AAC.12
MAPQTAPTASGAPHFSNIPDGALLSTGQLDSGALTFQRRDKKSMSSSEWGKSVVSPSPGDLGRGGSSTYCACTKPFKEFWISSLFYAWPCWRAFVQDPAPSRVSSSVRGLFHKRGTSAQAMSIIIGGSSSSSGTSGMV